VPEGLYFARLPGHGRPVVAKVTLTR
jgi:hypothetical protein